MVAIVFSFLAPKDYGYPQNRGKGNPRDTLKWLASYGAYGW